MRSTVFNVYMKKMDRDTSKGNTKYGQEQKMKYKSGKSEGNYRFMVNGVALFSRINSTCLYIGLSNTF